ncbi:hypothetical protein [Estrella lausannensis]|uniref:hypothetical protein n=1 Tax=Estrella lausannensis TaxID=483423 RepID=UPI00130456DB|nr:hypothetical protein [Estrella lausannensis]
MLLDLILDPSVYCRDKRAKSVQVLASNPAVAEGKEFYFSIGHGRDSVNLNTAG